MDDLDRAIVGVLHTDVRAPYSEIARLTGAEQTTVRRRVQAMLTAGTLNLFAAAGPEGLQHSHVLIKVRTLPAAVERVAAALVPFEQVIYVGIESAEPTVWLSTTFADPACSYEFLTTVVAQIDGVRSYQAHTITKVLKRRSAWVLDTEPPTRRGDED